MDWLAFWLFAALSAATLAAGVSMTRVTVAATLCGFFAGLVSSRWWPGDAAAAVVIGLSLGVVLWRHVHPWQRGALAGLAAGLAGVVMSAQGMTWPVAAMVALVIPLTACALAARHSGFAPAALVEPALCALLVASPAVAAWTQLESGWLAALHLNRTGAEAAPGAIPFWTLATLAIAAAAGIIRQQRMRR